MSRFLVLMVPLFLAMSARADDWPQWRGPNRTNISSETGLLKQWPKEGPPLLWKAEGLGEGVASVAVADGRVFTLGYRGEDEFVTAVAAKDGRRLWSTRIGPAIKEAGVMRWLSQRTPTIDDDRLYALTARGELVCLETASGKERWRRDYIKDFKGQRGRFGRTVPFVILGSVFTLGGIGAAFGERSRSEARIHPAAAIAP